VTTTPSGVSRAAWAGAWLVLLAVGAPAAAQPPPRAASGVKVDYRGTGVVLALLPAPSSLHATRPVIVIEHDPIAGLMSERMSMPFIAASTRLFDRLEVGDRIAFGLMSTADALLVVTVERVDTR
jgi:Copper binding periplasmic protein CusF